MVVLCDVGGVVSVEWGCAIDGVCVCACGAREEMWCEKVVLGWMCGEGVRDEVGCGSVV